MITVTHPTSNTFSRAAARAFLSAGLLREFNTCFAWDSHNLFSRLLPDKLLKQLARRSFPEIPQELIHSHPWRELLRLSGLFSRNQLLSRRETGFISVDAIYHSLDSHVAKRIRNTPDILGVYSYEDGALETFKAARLNDIKCFYDLPIGYWRAGHTIFSEEKEINPSWSCTLTSLSDSQSKLARKDEELSLADAVIVPSEFVRSTLTSYNACSAPIHVLPFGTDLTSSPSVLEPSTVQTSPLRVLFVGSLSQRKGLSYALEAVELLGDQVSFTLIGKPLVSNCDPLNSALSRHTWIPSLPHHEVLEQMRQHDVLLFPTLFDGFGLVITEALSQGLPVITTTNSGGPECIRDNVEGFIVPIRDSNSIAVCLEKLIKNKELLLNMKNAAILRSRDLSWKFYEERLLSIVQSCF